MNNDLTLEVLSQGQSLSPGSSVAINCPACNHQTARTMVVTRAQDGALLYYCHRASCHTKGVVGDRLADLPRTAPKKEIRQLEHAFGNVPSVEVQRLKDMGLTHEGWLFDGAWGGSGTMTQGPVPAYGIKYVPAMSRVAYPVLAPDGIRRGWVLRSYNKYATPKALLHMDDPADIALAWNIHPNPQYNTLVIVEDVASALRLTGITHAVALCGTNLSTDKVNEIRLVVREMKPRQVLLALDLDAWKLACDYAATYRAALNLVPIRLHTDIKNMGSDEEILVALGEEKGNK